MDYDKLASSIIEYVGGVENITFVTHCMTRLRFNLKDVKKAGKSDLENLKGVLGVVYSGGQYMVILGKNLLPVYEIITKKFDIQSGELVNENLDDLSEKEPLTMKSAGNAVLGYVSSAVTPLVPGLIAGGMLKVALLLIVTFIDSSFAATSTYTLLSGIADAPFYFMPIIIAYGAATKLGATPVYAMAAAASLLHSNYLGLVAGGESFTLFGIGIRAIPYGSSLLPALLIALAAYYAEKFLNKIIPGIFKSVFVGMGTIFIAGSLGFLILGPLGNMLGEFIASFFMFLSGTVGPVAVGLLAAVLPWLVMTGMHTAIAPFMTQLLTNPGYDAMIRPAFILHNMAEGGAVLGVAVRTKDKAYRSECISIAIGCIVAGVTEPAIYGINLKHRKPMIGVMAGGFAGGIIAGIMGAKAYVMGYSNILALPIFQDTVTAIVVGIIVSIAVACIVTIVLGIDSKTKNKEYKDYQIVAIADGNIIPLNEVNEQSFASGALGDGIAFELDDDIIRVPANGTLSVMFPTGHAFGVTTNEGVEILVHIGIDTVNTKGEGFKILAKQGDCVKAGQPMIEVDRKLLLSKGYDLTTMLIITAANGKNITLNTYGSVKQGTILR